MNTKVNVKPNIKEKKNKEVISSIPNFFNTGIYRLINIKYYE